jgi:hypothetical protein
MKTPFAVVEGVVMLFIAYPSMYVFCIPVLESSHFLVKCNELKSLNM